MKSKGCLLTHRVPMSSILFNISRICNSYIECNYLNNAQLFLNFSFQFWDINQILNISKKKMMFIANLFPKLQTVKNFVTALYKRRCFGTRLDSRHMKLSGILAKSPWECFYHFFSSISGKLTWKIFPLVLGEI